MLKEISTSISTFGRVPYGHNIIGRVELAYPLDACSKMSSNSRNTDSKNPLILLVERGNCTFADKAINAQASGAVAVLVMDNTEENVKYVLPYSKPEKAFAVTSPTLLLSKSDSSALFKAVTKYNSQMGDESSQVILSLTFPIEKKETADVVFKIDLNQYISVEDILELMGTFEEIKKKLNLEPVFNLHYHKIDTSSSNPFNCLKMDEKHKICSKRPGNPPFKNLTDRWCKLQ